MLFSSPKRAKIFVAILTVCLLYSFTRWSYRASPSRLVQASHPQQQQQQQQQQQVPSWKGDELEKGLHSSGTEDHDSDNHGPHDTLPQVMPDKDYTESSTSLSTYLISETDLIQDAHKRYTTAEAFLPYLRYITTHLKPVTMAESKAGCNWIAPQEVNFQYGDDADWVTQDRTDFEINLRRDQWHEFINKKLLPYARFKDRFDGRGIVIVAGNQKSLKRVRVILRQLAKLGSHMPIELHYWADEMTEESKQNMTDMWIPGRMFFNDLSMPSNIIKTNHDGYYINYQLKTAAVMNSRFAEPLLLDSDNIPLVAPESLYESDVYQEYGTLFWPDIARTRPNNPMWAITNTRCRTDEYEQESGQLVVDKRRYFYHLQLAAWLNNEQADYYNQFLLGDKDMFRFAWHALKTKYGKPKKWLTSVGTLSDDGYYCGHSFAQHYPDNDKVAFVHGGLIKTMSKEVLRWQRESRGGIFQVYKRSEFDEQHAVNVYNSIKWDGADYLPNRSADIEVASCTDFWTVQPRPLEEIMPGFEKRFEELGGYWMLDD
ncbi:mannosyltransferase putative-domain-containing protein [Talaromyces proteolyticus]|uniref:Mannosyltransferase putative-domain-containing protein n=1 Tax=Talaromyces proteolyticus TaxID=1131652 RepID=A0AAD4KWV6_9EURO|nr:mannosyltransferase putative-domain-containing protein [Talaromyces proteolyticus]KAH8700953.1 mannosyltransferase putative-domain-containing protein [Talaromyces proteolyticus]